MLQEDSTTFKIPVFYFDSYNISNNIYDIPDYEISFINSLQIPIKIQKILQIEKESIVIAGCYIVNHLLKKAELKYALKNLIYHFFIYWKITHKSSFFIRFY
jgi:hypothetical protein